MKRGLLLHWEQWGSSENAEWQEWESAVGPWGGAQKCPLGPWCSVVFALAILAGMSPSLFCSEFPVLSKLR